MVVPAAVVEMMRMTKTITTTNRTATEAAASDRR
jgi:hypothetical protein